MIIRKQKEIRKVNVIIVNSKSKKKSPPLFAKKPETFVTEEPQIPKQITQNEAIETMKKLYEKYTNEVNCEERFELNKGTVEGVKGQLETIRQLKELLSQIHAKSDESNKIIKEDKKITKNQISANKERKYISKAMNVPIQIPKVK